MPTVVGNRVKETTNTSGNTDPFTLLGAQTGFETFANGVGVGNHCYYCVIDGVDYEIGIGQLTNSTTLTRETILESTNGDNALNLTTATKTIFCEVPAQRLMYLDKDGALADPSGFRKAVAVANIAALQAQTGVEDGEGLFVLCGTTDDDMLGGWYEYRAASVSNLDSPNVIEAVGMGVGRFHKVRDKNHYEVFIPQSSEPTAPAAGWLAYSDGTSSTNGFGANGAGFYQYNGSAWKLFGSEVKSGANSPVGTVTPDTIGQFYHRTSNDTAWISVGLTSSDWRIISNEEWTQAVNAGSQKLYNLNRVDFEALSTEPGDATEGMLAFSNGTGSTNGFGDDGAGFYYYSGAAWSKVGSGISAGDVAVGDLANVAANTVLANLSNASGAPAAVTYAALLADMNMEVGVDLQAYSAALTDLSGKTVPSGSTLVDTTSSQNLQNKILTTPSLTLKQSGTPLPIAEGEVWWHTGDDNLVIGNGVDQTVIPNKDYVDTQIAAVSGSVGALGALASKDTIDSAALLDANVVTTAKILDSNVTLQKIADLNQGLVLGRASAAGTGVVTGLTGSQVKTILAIDAESDVSNLAAWAKSSYGSAISGSDIVDNPAFDGTAGIVVPIGSNAQRVNTTGRIRYNSDSDKFEGYQNGSWEDFVQAGASASTLDWSGLPYLAANDYDMANDSIVLFDSSLGGAVRTKLQDVAIKVTQINQASYTLVAGDGNTVLESIYASGAVTINIPDSTFPVGTIISLVQNSGHQASFAATGSTSMQAPGGDGTYERYSVISALQIATDLWVVFGDTA